MCPECWPENIIIISEVSAYCCRLHNCSFFRVIPFQSLCFMHAHIYPFSWIYWLIFKDYSSRKLGIGKRLWGDVEYVFIWFQFSVNWPWSPGLSRNMALDPMLFGDKTWNSFQQYKFFNLILWQNLSYIILHYLHCNDSFFESTTTDENLHSGFRI